MAERSSNQDYKDILVAGIGMSPAILTETVWSLAHRSDPFIPEKVVLITTVPGARKVQDLLLESGEWERMLETLAQKGVAVENALRFGAAQDHIRLLPGAEGQDDLDDILSPEDSAAAADSIMQTLREFTENPETRVVASIAGGRKTMSALMMSCMSLLGREQDRVCHVLVNPPYDRPDLDPPFFFPQKGVKHKCDGKVYYSAKAKLSLTDIPFVRTRGWYEKEYRNVPVSYSTLVNRFKKISPKPTNYPRVKIDLPRGEFRIGNKQIYLNSLEFAFMVAIMELRKEGSTSIELGDVADRIQSIKTGENMDMEWIWVKKLTQTAFDGYERPRKIASSLRTKLKKELGDPELIYALIPTRGSKAEPYPPNKIKCKGL